ncbi:MAG: DegV family EDD domain-containing protein [Gemmatimonadetes bacterium]|nr:DegV family EDD domain-containing protein [Gemmatimonadota bacterium]NNM04898.1 DegV family EDD domain-containing protein [Gemmatimonadota bacterium]
MRIAYLDGPRLRRSLLAACEYIQQQRRELNRINVFPVPDGDTGTNLSLTVQAIADHLRRNQDRDFHAVAHEVAQAAVLGARGNAGMMLSHFLLGFAADTRGKARICAREFGVALHAGADRLYDALERPVEGTILTVIRDTAMAALEAKAHDFHQLMSLLTDRARASLDRTPDLLPVLKKAGVVDAGGKGFVHLLEGVLGYIQGDSMVSAGGLAPVSATAPAVGQVEYPTEAERFRYCTEALVRGDDLPEQKVVREELRERGDSLIVIRSEEVIKVHVHTDDPEAVFAYLKTLGTLVTHKAEDMQAQHDRAERAAHGHMTMVRRPVGIVTDSACDLPEEIIRAHGIKVVPLILVRGEDTLRDGVDITAGEFHEALRKKGELPTTSQPAPGAFIEAYRRAAEEAEEVVGVMAGSNLSGTFASAEAAAYHFEGAPVHLVDSLGASLLEGLLVLKAAELAELAHSPLMIVEELKRIRRQSGVFLTVDSLDRLMASGRVGRGKAWLASVLGLKPVLWVPNDGGATEPAGRALGRKRMLPAVMKALKKRIPPGAKKVRFGVSHVGYPEIVPEVTGALRAEYGEVEILSAPATPVIATHTGIGAWAVTFLLED